MYKAERALDERMEYSQLAPNRWRATYRGFVTLSSEGRDPKDAQSNLDEAFDLLLAHLIRTSHRPLKAEPEIVVQETAEPLATDTQKGGASPQNDPRNPSGSRQKKDGSIKKKLRFKQLRNGSRG
jgi:predicted RNase H-like HicB family nuclease